MNNKITIGTIVFAVVGAIGLATQIDYKSKVAGPEKGDACVTTLMPLMVDNVIKCDIGKIHISKYSKLHPSDDNELTPAFFCNGALAPDQKCVGEIVGDGIGVVFNCHGCTTGVCCDPTVLRAEEKP